jgi:hypothetical protein
MGVPNRTMVNIGQVAMWIYADALSAIDPDNTVGGVYYPRGTGNVIYQDGLIFGGYVRDGIEPALRVGGQAYSTGMVPGRIVTKGQAESQSADDVRIWRIRRDYFDGDMIQDASEVLQVALSSVGAGEIAQVRAQYATDWREWPAAKGAPFYDADNDGVYTPQYNSDGSPILYPEADEPGIADADQVVWIVANDYSSANTIGLYGSSPVGVEEQVTLWAYRRSDALGQIIFKQFKLIFKGLATTPNNATIDTLYVCQWSDPDLGAAGDDLVGCDVNLSLGFVYNSVSTDGTFAAFALPPPASGYDFFAGPAVADPNGTAIINLKKRSGYRNLPMTSFGFFGGGEDSDPTRGGPYDGTLHWWNLLRGFRPRPISPPQRKIDPTTNQASLFWANGDPVAGTGWLDSNAGDRRLLLVSGPVAQVALGDTVETVVAALAGIGSDRLSSLAVLKFYDRTAQFAFDNLFDLPKAPSSPKFTATPFENAVLLNWGFDPDGVAATEGQDEKGFKFEGYNVYQLPSSAATPDQAIKLATYDAVNEVTTILQEQFDQGSGVVIKLPAQIGKNSGLARTLVVDTDKLRNKPLANGQAYYFAVTAYNFNPDPTLTTVSLESPLAIVSVVPQGPKPGVRYQAKVDDAVDVKHANGTSDASVTVSVVDPTVLTGQTYKVSYDTVGVVDEEGSRHIVTRWNLFDGANKLRAQSTDQSGSPDASVIIDGLNISVAGPVAGVRRDSQDDFNSGHSGVNYIPGANRAFTSQNWTNLGLDAWGEAFGTPASVGYAGNFAASGIIGGTTVSANDVQKVELRFSNDPAKRQKGYRYLRRATFATPDPAQEVFRINQAAGYPYQDYVEMPFRAYAIDAAGNERQINVGFLENNEASPLGELDGKWAPNANRGPAGAAAGREFLWIFASDYKDTPDPKYQVDFLGISTLDIQFVALLPARGAAVPQEGDILRIIPNYPAVAFVEEFSFVSKAPLFDETVAKTDVDKLVNVFPNPYYGLNRAELGRFSRYVTFSHLPQKATIRIFTLAGVLVRTIMKDDATQFTRWDMQNEEALPAASGIYIAHIDMPELGKTKVLKLAIVREEQFLPSY